MRSLSVLGLLLLVTTAFAQPATAPTTAPARFVLQVPKGYEKITIGGNTAICLPADAEWVKKSLADVKPATRPTTMPTDLIKRVTDNRTALIKQMVTDLGLKDEKEVSEFVDAKLLTQLQKLAAVKPPVFFLVCTRDQLKELVKTGWGEPRFYYNRVADSAAYSDNIMVSIEKPMDDAVLPAFVNEKDDAAKKAELLTKGVRDLNANLEALISNQSRPMVFGLFAEFIDSKYFTPLKLPRGQVWLGLGVTTFLSSKYSSVVTAVSKDQYLQELTFENIQFPVLSKSIDLSNPIAESSMKPVAVPYYNQAIRRKGTLAVMKLVETGGEAAIPRTIEAVRLNKPADGAALVKLIKDATGVDIAPQLAPQ